MSRLKNPNFIIYFIMLIVIGVQIYFASINNIFLIAVSSFFLVVLWLSLPIIELGGAVK